MYKNIKNLLKSLLKKNKLIILYSINFFRYYDAISSLPPVSINDLDRNIILIKEQEQQVKKKPNLLNYFFLLEFFK